MWYFNPEGALYLALIEYREVRSCDLCRELVAMARLYLALVIAALSGNLGCKVVPRTYTLVREVVDTALVELVALDDVRDDRCKICGVCW